MGNTALDISYSYDIRGQLLEKQRNDDPVSYAYLFAQEAELAQKLKRVTELNAFLNMNEKDGSIDMDDNPETAGN